MADKQDKVEGYNEMALIKNQEKIRPGEVRALKDGDKMPKDTPVLPKASKKVKTQMP